MKEKIQIFADKLQAEQMASLAKHGYTYPGWENNAKVTIKTGKKYTKVDLGNSGKYMIDQEGNIYGIKAYGVIHGGHHYGTLDTIDNYDWSGYTAKKIQ